MATLNLIQYLNFKPTLIEKLDPEEYKTEFMPEEQTVQYQEKFGLRTVSFTKAYSSRVSANHVGSQIQIEVEFENITHIEVRRILRLELDQTLRTVIDAKSENRDISFSLVYNTTKISGHEHVPDLIRLLTDNKNIIDEFNLVNIKSYLDSKKFIEGVLINNKKIRKFTYPKSIKPTHLAALEKIFKTLEKCSIRITDEILDLVIT